MVGLAHYENTLGKAFFQLHAECGRLKSEMLAYAEEPLWAETEDGESKLLVFINDFDLAIEALVEARGYEIVEGQGRAWSNYQFDLPGCRVDPGV
jgi:hypothetical protein